MSGNQESQISLPTWRYSDYNAAIPIKKRKFFVQPQLPAMEEAVTTFSQPNEQGDTSVVGKSALDSSENQKIVDGSKINIREPIPSLPAVSVGNTDKAVSIDQIRVKAEQPDFPIYSTSSKLPVALEHPAVVLKTHETFGEKNLRGECQTEASASVGTASMQLVCKTNKRSPYRENKEPTSLNLSLSKGFCAPCNTDSIAISMKSGNRSGVNRANWDLNTTMDDWEDPLDRRTRVKTTGAFFNSNTSLDTTAVVKSTSEKQKESVGFKSPTVSLMKFDHQVNPTCSLSLGLSSYPPIKKSTTSEASTSISGPLMIAGNVNSVNLRTVKSEIIEESVRQETENTQVCPIGLSINGVKPEVVGRFSQAKNPSSGVSKSADPISVKAEPYSFTESEVINWKDRALNRSHTPIMQSNEILDLPTSSTANQIPSSDCRLKENLAQSRSADNGKLNEVLKHGGGDMTTSCSGDGDQNLDASGVNVTSLTEVKLLNDCKTSEELLRISHGTDEGKIILSGNVEEKRSQPAAVGNTELQKGILDESGEKVQDGEQTTHQITHASEGISGVSTVSGGNIENREEVDNSSPGSYKAEMSTIDDDTPAEFSEGSQSRLINLAQVSNNSPNKTLDASDGFVPLQMERDRLPDFQLEPRKYPLRGSDESYKFSRERYHGKVMRSPRLNFMPDKRRLFDQTESNLHDRDTKCFEFDNHGNSRRGGGFMNNFHRGRRPANDEGPNSFQRRTPNFSFTHRGPRNKDDASAFNGFRDGEKFTRGSQCNNTEPMFMSPHRPYRGRNGGFSRGRTKFTNNSKRDFPGFRSRSPVRSRERSPGPSSSFRNRSEENFSGHTEFSHRRSPSSYRTERINSPDHSGYPRETVNRRHGSPPFSHRPSNGGRGRGYTRGRGYARGQGYVRGRGYGRDGNSFRKPYDRVFHRNHDPRERIDYSEEFVERPPNHSERFGIDGNVERRRFGGYRDDGTGTSSFIPSFNNDGCAPTTNVENDPDAARLGEDSDMDIDEQGSVMETYGNNKNSTESASERPKNMEEEESSKHGKIWQPDEPGDDKF